MKENSICILLILIFLVLLTACNNSVEQASQPPQITPPLQPGVSVELNDELQDTMTLNGTLTVKLTQDDNPALEMVLAEKAANLDQTAAQMRGEHRYHIAVSYTSHDSGNTVLVAEADKSSTKARVVFKSDELHTVPYDKDNSGTIEQGEQQLLDSDLDEMPNLTEIRAGGNPNNPGPSFLSDISVKVPEKQSQPNGLYAEYKAEAISPRANTTLIYTIVGGAAANRFNLEASSGVLSFVDDISNNTSWPEYIPGGNNKFTVDIKADDGTLSNILTVTVTITDVFNLQVTMGIKTLDFSWFEVPDAAYYKLLENPDGNSGFKELASADRIQGLRYSHGITVYNYDSLNARYML